MPHAKGYFDRDPKIVTHNQMMERLRELTGSKVLPPLDPGVPNQPLEKITVSSVVPQGAVAEPPTLEWLKPIYHKDESGTCISSGGQYEIRKRRLGDAWQYTIYRGLDVIGGPYGTAQEAKDCALAHYRDACA